MSITPEMVINKYLEDREKIRAIRKAAETQVEAIEASQKKREDYLLKLDAPSIFDFMTEIYIDCRDGKALAERQKDAFGAKQGDIEKWLLKTLDSLKSKGLKTEFGTVFPTRKESVSVDDFDALLDFAVAKPAATAIAEYLTSAVADIVATGIVNEEELAQVLRASAHFEYLNKAVNKTSVLEQMGDLDAKSNSRPNPAPPGVKYTAIRTVGVRKGKD